MKGIILMLILILQQLLHGQSFTEISHFNSFVDLGDGPTLVWDFNGDNSPDIIIGGTKPKLFF